MSQDHYVWIGPPSYQGGHVLLTDQLVYPVDLVQHHLEPIRGSAYTLAVFGKVTWDIFIKVRGHPPSQAIGYTTVHALGVSNGSVYGTCQSAAEWMAATGYKWEGPK